MCHRVLPRASSLGTRRLERTSAFVALIRVTAICHSRTGLAECSHLRRKGLPAAPLLRPAMYGRNDAGRLEREAGRLPLVLIGVET